MIFQDPYGSLGPHRCLGTIIGQPLAAAGRQRHEIRERVRELIVDVGLPDDAESRLYPPEFSGGGRQRIGIARALPLNPKIVICDAPVSTLDVSVRAQVINLLESLQAELGVSYLCISHDVSIVDLWADRALVMYLGCAVEAGAAEDLWRHSAHPYMAALLAAAPIADPVLARRQLLASQPARAAARCAFRSRWTHAQQRCRRETPPLRAVTGRCQIACHSICSIRRSEADLNDIGAKRANRNPSNGPVT